MGERESTGRPGVLTQRSIVAACSAAKEAEVKAKEKAERKAMRKAKKKARGKTDGEEGSQKGRDIPSRPASSHSVESAQTSSGLAAAMAPSFQMSTLGMREDS